MGTFAVLHYGLKPPPPAGSGSDPRGMTEIKAEYRDDGGYYFPALGYVLCPQGVGIDPTEKEISPGTFVVIWLGDPQGAFIERTWAEVVKVDPDDPNRLFVVIRGELFPSGQRSLQTDKHGFNLSQVFWMTRDCIPDAYNELGDPNGVLLCGANLVTFDGPDDDLEPDGLGPARPPALPPRDLVGWQVELLLVSRAGRGSAWQVPVVAEIVDVGPTGDVPRVRVIEIGSDEFADAPPSGHHLSPGDEFDAPWDCITRYLRS